jgi:hypothetical protein
MEELTYGLFALVLGLTVVILMSYVSYDRQKRWPELEPNIVKQRQAERRKEHLIWLQAQEERIRKEDEEYLKQQKSE